MAEPQMESMPEQPHLLKRIMRLTLLLGILSGMWLVFLGVMLYDFLLRPTGAFSLVDPRVDEVLLPLLFLLQGSIVALRWHIQRLRTQLFAFWHANEGVRVPQVGHPLIIGLFTVGMGGWLLINYWGLHLDEGVFATVLLVGFGGMLLSDWFFWRRGHRRVASR
jgi:hypothetical protein